MLNFTGVGSAFNTEKGNTSAFIKKNNSLFLIDCGGTVFHRLQQLSLLTDVERLYIAITHTHPDHVGSLGDILFYAYYILKCKATVFFPEKELITSFLSSMGVGNDVYDLNSLREAEVRDIQLGELKIAFEVSSHVDTIPAYSILIELNAESFYYSGDANQISSTVIDKLRRGEISQIYQDTCALEYEGNAHLSINKLCDMVPYELRKRVCCMHLDKHMLEQELEEKGFCVARPYM